MFTIKATKREEGIKTDTLKSNGQIPAVFYGAGSKTTSISISIIDFKKIWREAGESSTVKVTVDGKSVDALIHEVQVHPITEEPLHVDFLVVDMNKKIEVGVPLEFIGISNAVKNGSGNLVKVLHEVEIEALPKDLPHKLEVDLSKLETTESQIFVSDIKLPSGVVMITDLEEVVASIILQVEEKEEVSSIDLSTIEVEKKGKKEEEAVDTTVETK
ncbi:MAG: 50S ribosomal protein L25 [Candidatus Nomurabacteria bacterium GW2011_GWE1_32_28]|uniref:Large ribosomal subunit protein bL25 n=1 Tax=Candidatus Nomurabacteria bacterium GW2011_GWF1_31_48 TaxID=1618767 RepID=A0A0F9YFP2_9BACT|nr:MAG: 50S ribosomal protein L25 [Candidatus Nomurabacteria bacterium GW2011_GWF2_30_133]KKP29046.1 MAG: 50S ribosomal protein L25 [Candidatus Nomurabacteria bacterium GW2011_GWE2_31_40]KKP30544.1 MAG: 50S ribosomal protein L25 [Candidatus Nomurabacteria bacterium GW2011_GWF1_31_48]KKP35029.1 MAG: 50S ribosomal protein L25 [Candidatus Nomurabacteria bacterium GW2011_GWE1_32_28]HAS80606.1 50S ribosomal protein L25 [Candidatus Nomurabacteria bacterium]